jgi:5-methylcytosine-specific restriction endonuclease McrA
VLDTKGASRVIWLTGQRATFNRRTKNCWTRLERTAAPRYWATTVKNPRLRGKLRKAAEPIEFTLDEFRDWVLNQFHRGGGLVAIKCPYCGVEITIENFSLDHKVPRSWTREARHAFDNLCLCCAECNTAKGIMTADEFIWFRKIIFAALPKQTADYVLRSLRVAEVQRQSFFRKGKIRGGGLVESRTVLSPKAAR